MLLCFINRMLKCHPTQLQSIFSACKILGDIKIYYIEFVFGKGKCNTPPTIVAERSWNVAENTVIFLI